MHKHPNRAIGIWLLIGLSGYFIFPWYAIQDTAWYYALPQILGGAETANAIVQILAHGRSWLLLGLLGLGLAAVGFFAPPGRTQSFWLLSGGLGGLLGLGICGFVIGARG